MSDRPDRHLRHAWMRVEHRHPSPTSTPALRSVCSMEPHPLNDSITVALTAALNQHLPPNDRVQSIGQVYGGGGVVHLLWAWRCGRYIKDWLVCLKLLHNKMHVVIFSEFLCKLYNFYQHSNHRCSIWVFVIIKLHQMACYKLHRFHDTHRQPICNFQPSPSTHNVQLACCKLRHVSLICSSERPIPSSNRPLPPHIPSPPPTHGPRWLVPTQPTPTGPYVSYSMPLKASCWRVASNWRHLGVSTESRDGYSSLRGGFSFQLGLVIRISDKMSGDLPFMPVRISSILYRISHVNAYWHPVFVDFLHYIFRCSWNLKKMGLLQPSPLYPQCGSWYINRVSVWLSTCTTVQYTYTFTWVAMLSLEALPPQLGLTHFLSRVFYG